MSKKPFVPDKNLTKVLTFFLESEKEWNSGYEVCAGTRLRLGFIYPLLYELERKSWLEAKWEDNVEIGKPRRRYYKLTAGGRRRGLKILQDKKDGEEVGDTSGLLLA